MRCVCFAVALICWLGTSLAASDYAAEVLYRAAQGDRQAGKHGAAAKLLCAALSQKGPYPEAQFLLGQCQEALGQQGEALKAYRACVSAAKKVTVTTSAISEALRMSEDRILELDADQRELEDLKAETAEKLLDAARAFANKGNHHMAASACVLVLKWLPEHKAARELFGEASRRLPSAPVVVQLGDVADMVEIVKSFGPQFTREHGLSLADAVVHPYATAMDVGRFLDRDGIRRTIARDWAITLVDYDIVATKVDDSGVGAVDVIEEVVERPGERFKTTYVFVPGGPRGWRLIHYKAERL